MGNIFEKKHILITGGTGSIGSAIVKRLLDFNPKVIRVLSNDENALFDLKNELKMHDFKLRFLLGDIRDKERLNLAMEKIDIVYHAAALKHVPLCEYNPFEAIKTNILGTQNVIETARMNDVERLIFISTDKSVEPVNTMGATKLLGERLTIEANYYKGLKTTRFSCVRFGNILNSRGSIIPICLDQLNKGLPLTITNREMTRFVISIESAVNFIFKSTELMKGGEVFIIKNMKSVRILDLMIAIRNLYCKQTDKNPDDIRIESIGKRAGERLHEFLMTEDETANALETTDLFIILPKPDLHGVKLSAEDYDSAVYTTKKHFSSNDDEKLTLDEIISLLEMNDIIRFSMRHQ